MIISTEGRGLYFTLFREKPPEKKLLLLADFIKNWAPFIKNSILTIFSDPKAKRSENAPSSQIQSLINSFCCTLLEVISHRVSMIYFKSAIKAKCVETTPVTQTVVEFMKLFFF